MGQILSTLLAEARCSQKIRRSSGDMRTLYHYLHANGEVQKVQVVHGASHASAVGVMNSNPFLQALLVPTLIGTATYTLRATWKQVYKLATTLLLVTDDKIDRQGVSQGRGLYLKALRH